MICQELKYSIFPALKSYYLIINDFSPLDTVIILFFIYPLFLMSFYYIYKYAPSLSDHISTSLSTEYAAFAGLVDGSVSASIPNSFS